MSKNKIVKVSLLGSSGVGKTTLIQFLLEGTFSKFHSTTIGVDFKRYKFEKDKTVQIWDNPGQQNHRNIIWQMNKRFKAFIFIFDLSDGESFSRINQWLQQLQERMDMQKIIFYAFGNKSDKPRKIEKDFIQNFWAERGIQYNQLSLLNSGNTRNIVDRVLGQIWYKSAYLQMQQQNDLKKSIRLDDSIQEKNIRAKRKCC